MLERINIENFKSFKNSTIELKKLNLFVGTNSSGKSSAIQSLLILHQNYLKEELCGFNGSYISLGSFIELKNVSSRKIESVCISAEEGEKKYGLKFSSMDESGGMEYTPYRTSSYSEYDETIKYLSCHRIGAQNLYEKNFDNNREIGIEGEYAISYLASMGSQFIENDIVISNSNEDGEPTILTNDLKTQTNYWLYKIVSSKIKVDEIDFTDCVRAQYLSTVSDEGMEKYTRPIHVGSGISYLISIIVTCLSSKKGDIIVIENPEIHLHPKAQAQLCDFLYHIAKSDRQLIIETHSDHIFDGIRAGIATNEMESENIAINFFRRNNNSNTEVVPITIEKKGRISSDNPEDDLKDLFDQFDINLDRMLGM